MGLAHDGVEPAERGPLVQGYGLSGQNVSDTQRRAFVAEGDRSPTAHPHAGFPVAGSVGERRGVPVPGGRFRAVAAGERLGVLRRN